MTRNRRPKTPTDLAKAMRELSKLRERVFIAEALAREHSKSQGERPAEPSSPSPSPRRVRSDEKQ